MLKPPSSGLDGKTIKYGGFDVSDFTFYITNSDKVHVKMLFSEGIEASADESFPDRDGLIEMLDRIVSFKIQHPDEEHIAYICLPSKDDLQGYCDTYVAGLNKELDIGDVVSVTREDIHNVLGFRN